jgi:hypothetical protein
MISFISAQINYCPYLDLLMNQKANQVEVEVVVVAVLAEVHQEEDLPEEVVHLVVALAEVVRQVDHHSEEEVPKVLVEVEGEDRLAVRLSFSSNCTDTTTKLNYYYFK